MSEKRHCCFDGCNTPAEFNIVRDPQGVDPYEGTDACETHVGALLGYTSQPFTGGWHVEPIEGEQK